MLGSSIGMGARGNVLIAPDISGTVTAATALTLPAHTSGDITIGANRLKTTNLVIKQVDANFVGVFEATETSYRNWYVSSVGFNYALTAIADGVRIQAYDIDGNYLVFNARDTGVGLVEVARLQGLADPYFGIGVDGNALKGTNGGLLGFFAATPVGQQTGCAVPTDLTTCIASITALRTALNNLGLTTVV